jgi:hypothetical protein
MAISFIKDCNKSSEPTLTTADTTLPPTEIASIVAAKTQEEENFYVIVSWTSVEEANADCLVVACCGFGFDRNIRDNLKQREKISSLRAAQEDRECMRQMATPVLPIPHQTYCLVVPSYEAICVLPFI